VVALGTQMTESDNCHGAYLPELRRLKARIGLGCLLLSDIAVCIIRVWRVQDDLSKYFGCIMSTVDAISVTLWYLDVYNVCLRKIQLHSSENASAEERTNYLVKS